jgi:hypothetical protein
MGEGMTSRYKSSKHSNYACKHGDDTREIAGFRWGQGRPAWSRGTSTEGDNV